MLSCDRVVILFISGTLALTTGACSRLESSGRLEDSSQPIVTSTTPRVSPQPSTPPESAETQTQPTATELYKQALDAAYSAATISQSAQSGDDWQLVISRWQEAIALLESVSSSSPNYAIAQSKIAEYQGNLNIAQQQATSPRLPDPEPLSVATKTVTKSPDSSDTDQANPATSENPLPGNIETPKIVKAPIKQRIGQTPVIEVTFNGEQTFNMVVDTGASGTVITQAMAQRLGVVPEGEITADTASAKGVKFAIGQVKSIAVGEAAQQNINVAIGGANLDVGLLGQDFYSHYDVVIRENVVEFHHR
ncbi:MAG: retropepsin-like aspartic protease [Coleofasciculus sp. D1-CHI-01]|uniref:retropepsin-like aspartic protease family protein n=1 Tax=Coleofasciculus sp. D1-CHI-01 TaxID=3068482 RepID=UPI0033051A0D